MRAKTAVILAAGRGSRLGTLTDDKPKCLVELAGKPLLAWQLEALRQAGIKNIHVVRGYRKECLVGPGYEVIDNPRWQETNMVVSLRCASAILERAPTIVTYADVLYHPGHAERLAVLDEDIAITYDIQWLELWRARFDDPLSDAETFRVRDGWLEAIGERAASYEEIQGQYMGLLRFTPHGWGTVANFLDRCTQEHVDQLDITALLQKLLALKARIAVLPVAGGWCEVDNVDDLRLYEQQLLGLIKDQALWNHDWRGAASYA